MTPDTNPRKTWTPPVITNVSRTSDADAAKPASPAENGANTTGPNS